MLEIQLLGKKKNKWDINTNFKMKIQNLEHVENHTSIFNNSVNMQIQIENSTLRGGKKKTTHEIQNYSKKLCKSKLENSNI
jgi:hypothetical protein